MYHSDIIGEWKITRYIKDATFDKDPLSWETELILPYKLDF